MLKRYIVVAVHGDARYDTLVRDLFKAELGLTTTAPATGLAPKELVLDTRVADLLYSSTSYYCAGAVGANDPTYNRDSTELLDVRKDLGRLEAILKEFKAIIPTKLPDIADYEVKVAADRQSVKVGCTTVTKAEVERIWKAMQ